MSKDYEGQDPLVLAQQAERDLNSHQAKHGASTSDSGRTVDFFGIFSHFANTLHVSHRVWYRFECDYQVSRC